MKFCGSVSMVAKKVDIGHRPPPRVLIVEDNSLIAMDLEDILRRLRVRSRSVQSPPSEKALEALSAERSTSP